MDSPGGPGGSNTTEVLPPVIRKLEEVVINRIAAGEIIQRPSNAVKELLENSLDAKCSSISINLKNGGLKLLQIQDNGTGIRKEDLGIVCERFTTSKLTCYEDLGTISTYGFRGEALASISHIAHLTITTKTANEQCAYKASYTDGKLNGLPKACAANQGTLISVEDLFYNVPTRKKAFKNPNEEHARVVDVVSRYAVHNPTVGFSLKKFGENLSDVKTSNNSSHIDNIRLIYGNNIARELLEIELNDDIFKFSVSGYISNVNFSTKKQIFILFINNRLVDSTALRKSLETVYSLYLPKGSHPFIYLSLSMDPRNVDVNVHPTKHEVHFLHEDSVIENTRQALESKLLGANTSRVFYTQAKLPLMDVTLKSAVLEKACADTKAPAPKHMVRTDASAQKLDRFLTAQCSQSSQESNPSFVSLLATAGNHGTAGLSLKVEDGVQAPKHVLPEQEAGDDRNRKEIKLTSVLTLRLQIEEECNIALRDIVSNLIFIGSINTLQALIQHETVLYLMNTKRLLEELFYQIMLYNFGNFGVIKFQSGLPLYDVAMLGIEDPNSHWKEEDGSKEELATLASDLLASKAAMLQDYFSIEINQKKELRTIPLLLENYTPDISWLPLYVLRLACDVDWDSEQACFQGVCRETARFYSYISSVNTKEGRDWQWVVEHIVYPSIKATLLPPKRFAGDETILKIVNLPDLYKVFERC